MVGNTLIFNCDVEERMKKILIACMVLSFSAATLGLASAQVTPAQGVAPAPSISKTSKNAKKGHGCHGKKCSKTSTTTSK
jgi:hypothetical protein